MSTEAPLSNAPSGFKPDSVPAAPRPHATPDRTLHMIGNAHLDPVWLWPWQARYQEARATFKSALDRMDEYPDFIFTCDQIVLLSWVEEQDPEMFARIQERVAEGRWVNAGGWWVSQVDVVVVTEHPKFGPYREQMRIELAKALGVREGEISIKGKTNEKMGWIGRGEGLACMVVATITDE